MVGENGEHRIFFHLNEYVGVGVLSEIMNEFGAVPESTEYEGEIAFFLNLTKEDTDALMDMFGWAIVTIMDFDQKEEGGNYV